MCPNQYANWQTMCASVDLIGLPNDTEHGKQFRRTLEEHDKDTFDDAYS